MANQTAQSIDVNTNPAAICEAVKTQPQTFALTRSKTELTANSKD
jgi:hypothetical protein